MKAKVIIKLTREGSRYFCDQCVSVATRQRNSIYMTYPDEIYI